MNKDNYKNAFSQVRPSEETVERIFEMSETKKRGFIRHKGLIAIVACLIALLCGTLTANAATDGALFEGLKLVVNGEDVDIADYIKSHKEYETDDGIVVNEYEFELDDKDGSLEFSLSKDGESDADTGIIIQKNNEDDSTYTITEE